MVGTLAMPDLYQTCARPTDHRGGISKIFPRRGIEGGIFFDEEMRKKPEKTGKTGFFCLNLTKLTLI